MADFNISAVDNSQRIQLSTTDQVKAADKLKDQIEEDSSRKEHVKEVLEDVIATSRDGDTAQASKTSKDKLKESEELGDVKKMPDKNKSGEQSAAMKLLDEIQEKQKNKPSPAEQLRETIKRAKEQKKANDKLAEKNSFNAMQSESASSAKKQSYDSYSDAQLQQMYVNGDISRYDYDHEMSNRSEKNKESSNNTKEEKVFNEGIVRAVENEREAEIGSEAVDRAFSDYANDNMRAEQRMAMIDAAELLT